MEKLADNLQRLGEDDLLQVVEMVHNNKTSDTYTKNDVERMLILSRASFDKANYLVVQKANSMSTFILYQIVWYECSGTFHRRNCQLETQNQKLPSYTIYDLRIPNMIHAIFNGLLQRCS